ncbi:MAG: metallophosphoesterase [Firmicutes bacterium]|nr:metallophosphoesterase [Bacillota bacterium]
MLKTKRRKYFMVLLLLLLAAGVYLGVGIVKSLYLETSLIELVLPAKGEYTATVRVAQVSDLHLAVYGENNQDLVDLIASKHPTIILATGDMIDARAKSIDPTIDLFTRLRGIAPIVYSLGNHEMDRQDLRELVAALEKAGVRVVHNSIVTLDINGMTLTIGGLYRAEHLRELENSGPIDILLCHFPDKIDFFAHYGVPLTFCGHTHGGQFRVPLFDIPLYAPGQGWLPEYTVGLYERYGSFMIVSRGLGNSSFPFRVFNPPEVVIADITYAPMP